ncbi:MAG: ABC transporter substrate-binding protein [Immundisolibacterales bacterium]|nr:ABC transporter substrate-binding protein [Immundisolibacterales bacterium]
MFSIDAIARLARTIVGGALAALLAIAPAAIAEAAQKVTYLLPAPAFLPAFGPWMLAKGKGYYAEEGLEVEFVAARGGVDVAKQVGAGNAVIGGGIGDTPLIVRANGIPVKAVAVLGGGSLMILATDQEAGIDRVEDLKGRTVTTMSYQDTTFYALLGMLASVGLTRNDIDAQAAGPSNTWKLFIAGEADAMAAVPDWIAIAAAQGKKMNLFPADAHFRSMAQAILAADDVIAEQPELIGKLVRATLKGMRDIMADPEQAARDYVKAVPQHEGQEKAMEAVFRLYNQHVYPGQETLGAMDADRLAALQDFYVGEGIVREAVPVEDLYTNRFVQ